MHKLVRDRIEGIKTDILHFHSLQTIDLSSRSLIKICGFVGLHPRPYLYPFRGTWSAVLPIIRSHSWHPLLIPYSLRYFFLFWEDPLNHPSFIRRIGRIRPFNQPERQQSGCKQFTCQSDVEQAESKMDYAWGVRCFTFLSCNSWESPYKCEMVLSTTHVPNFNNHVFWSGTLSTNPETRSFFVFLKD